MVVVNSNSPDSQALGKYYQELRGLPSSHIFQVSMPTAVETTRAVFDSALHTPLFDYLTASGLKDQIDIILLSMDIPYRIADGSDRNGTSSALFYGFRNYANSPTCVLPETTEQAYFMGDRAFHSTDFESEGRYYISALLTAETLDEARTVVDHAVLADFTTPAGEVHLTHSLDPARAVQWPRFELTALRMEQLPDPVTPVLLTRNTLVAGATLNGASIGRANPSSLPSVSFTPGAIGEHVTSLGGQLLESTSQMSALEWMKNGCAGTYGATIEPCNYPQKFPVAELHYWYARGYTLGECFMQSVQHPYMGVVAGDPLCAPHAQPGTLVLSGPAGNGALSGTVSWQLSGTAADALRPLDRAEFFLDGLRLAEVAHLALPVGEQVTVNVQGDLYTVTTQAGDTRYTLAQRLADHILAVSTGPYAVVATARGDRVEIRQALLGQDGSGWTYAVSSTHDGIVVSPSSGSQPFLQKDYTAKEGLVLEGTLVAGDTVSLTITRLDGVDVSHSAIALTGDTTHDLMGRLQTAVNNDPALQGTEGAYIEDWNWIPGYPVKSVAVVYALARQPGWEGVQLHLDYQVTGADLEDTSFSDYFNDNGPECAAWATVYLAEGTNTLTASYAMDTTLLDDGWHRLYALVYEGTSVETQTGDHTEFLVDNHGMSCGIVSPVPFHHVPLNTLLPIVVEASSPGQAISSVELWVEGKWCETRTTAPFEFSLPVGNYGPGPLELQARAMDAAGQVCRSRWVLLNVYRDQDSDQLPDEWERDQFGSITAYEATHNPDTDPADNLHEFTAGTNPLDPLHYLRITDAEILEGALQVEFVSDSQRRYLFERLVESPPAGLTWQAYPGGPIYGTGNLTTTPLPLDGSQGVRVQALVP